MSEQNSLEPMRIARVARSCRLRVRSGSHLPINVAADIQDCRRSVVRRGFAYAQVRFRLNQAVAQPFVIALAAPFSVEPNCCYYVLHSSLCRCTFALLSRQKGRAPLPSGPKFCMLSMQARSLHRPDSQQPAVVTTSGSERLRARRGVRFVPVMQARRRDTKSRVSSEFI